MRGALAPVVASWVVAVAGSTTVIPTQTWIATGPAFAGSRALLWGVNTPSAAVYASDPVRRVWQAPRVSPPSDVQNDPFFDAQIDQRISKVAASKARAAFIRAVDLRLVPKCASQVPPCMAIPVRLEPLRSELWTGPPPGPFKRLNRDFTVDVDVDGAGVVYSTRGDESKVVARRRTIALSRELVFPEVALAGHYAGWTEVPRTRNFTYTPRALVVYDLRAHRVAYRLDPSPFADFDLAPNGTVAFGQDPAPLGGSDGGVGWASVAEPRPHFLHGNAVPFDVRLGGRRIAYFTRSPSALVVQALDGEVIARRQAAYGGFDFDGHRLAYLQSPRVLAVDRLR